MTLAEQLVLLALDPERGQLLLAVDRKCVRRGIAAAILAELVLHQRAVPDGTGLRLADVLPDFHPLLSEAVQLLARRKGPMQIPAAVDRIERGIADLTHRAIRSLVARDILHHYREAFIFHRYPVRSMQALSETVSVLQTVVDGQHVSPTSLAFAAIVDACGVGAARMSTEDRFRMRRHIDPSVANPAGKPALALILRIALAAAKENGR